MPWKCFFYKLYIVLFTFLDLSSFLTDFKNGGGFHILCLLPPNLRLGEPILLLFLFEGYFGTSRAPF